MKNATIVFDFDGTIADTHACLVRISNRLSKEFKYKTIEPHEVEYLKGKTSYEVIEHLSVPVLKIPIIVKKAKKELQKELESLQPIAGLKEILLQLKSLGHKIGILSSNSKENVMSFLQKHELDFFDFINTTSKIWSKNAPLNRIIQNRKLRPEEILYVGDEIRDIAAAKKAGVKVAAVAWGYNSLAALQAHKPDYLVHKPEDLISLSDNF